METAELLSFKVLGGLSIKLNGSPVSNLASRKAEALLVYLACNPQEHSREKLATLLWDDRPLARSLGNLSVLLTSLRKEVAPFVRLGRSSLSFNGESNYRLDSRLFEEQISLARQQQSSQPLRTAAAQLTQALALYQGAFLAGFYIREAREFEEWVLLEQERLQRLAIEGLSDLVDFHLLRNQTQEGIEQAARLLALDPLREGGHRQMMRLLALDGQRSAALAQFESCRQLLADELDVEPAEATVELYEQIRSGDWIDGQHDLGTGRRREETSALVVQSPEHIASNLHNLPAQTTSFIGREHELSQITRRLEEPACRLLTLVGHGGIGKTRLALEVANRQVGRFLHGVWFVALAGLSSADGLAPAIADALGLAFTGRSGLEEELFEYLQQKEMLIVLDNFEQLLAADTGPTLLQAVLQQASNITLLVTSRERLSLAAEWLVALDGLPYPARGDEQDPGQFAAVQLFIQRAQQIDGKFTPKTAPLATVQKICQLVEGMPLALELAATWLRVYTCEQIAAHIEEDLGFLSTRLRDVPARHRSLQAVFDHSWQLMSPAEQTLLKRLTVFQGGFTSEAVLQVAEAAGETLASLVDKSLVRAGQTEQPFNRFELHELLRQFAAVRLAEDPAEKAETLDRHGRYYAQFCEKQEARLKSGQVAEALEVMAEEAENLQVAWHRLLNKPGKPAYALLAQMMEGFFVFFEMRGRFQEGLGLAEEAVTIITEDNSGEGKVVQGQLLAWAGWFNFRVSNYEKGLAMAEKGLTTIQAEGAWQFTAYPLLFLGAASYGLGKLEQAQDYFQQSLAVYQQLDDAWGIAGDLSNLGHIATSQGNYEAAEAHLLECLTVTQANEISYLHSRGLQTLGRLYTVMGKVEPARRSMEETLKISRAIGDKYSEAMTLLDLGQLNMKLGNEDAAVTYLQRGQELFSEIGDRLNEYWALIHLGEIAFRQKTPNHAYQYWSAALQKGQQIRAPAIILAAVKGIARLRALGGNTSHALALLSFVKNHPVADHETREEAVTHFETLAESLTADKVKAAERLAAGWDLEQMVANL